MKNKGILAKILAVTGAALVWIPLLFTIFTAAVGTISTGTLRFDYLMPAELFPFTLAGGVLLTVAAFMARAYCKPILWSLIIAAAALTGGQTYAVSSGLASGAIQAEGLPWALVLASLAIYALALIFLIVAGTRFAWRLLMGRLP
jgi:hypothetical protein